MLNLSFQRPSSSTGSRVERVTDPAARAGRGRKGSRAPRGGAAGGAQRGRRGAGSGRGGGGGRRGAGRGRGGGAVRMSARYHPFAGGITIGMGARAPWQGESRYPPPAMPDPPAKPPGISSFDGEESLPTDVDPTFRGRGG